jgi:NAD(P)H-dependent FMN reductase
MLNVKIIIGSTRPSRFSELLVPWIENAAKGTDLSLEVLDLREIDIPYFNETLNPSYVQNGEYGNSVTQEWAKKINSADAFIVISPEYNHGYSAVLKNALDVIYSEWNKKAIGFVSYGSVGGSRAVEQLRQVAVELQMASTRTAVHIHAPWFMRKEDGSLKDDALKPYDGTLNNLLDEIIWWGNALKIARTK